MSRPLLPLVILASCLVFLSQPPRNVAAQSLGPEFRVNTYTTYGQDYPCLSVDGAGNVIVVWTSASQDGDMGGVFAQRFDSNLLPIGVEFQVNTTTTGDQDAPDVAANEDGGFIVTWNSEVPSSFCWSTIFQRYDETGTPVGSENTLCGCWSVEFLAFPQVVFANRGHSQVFQGVPYLAPDLGRIYTLDYDESGTPCHSICGFVDVDDDFYGPFAACNGGGDYAVTWCEERSDGSQATCAHVGRICESGGPMSDILPTSFRGLTDVAMKPNGDWLFVWPTYEVASDTTVITARWYDLSIVQIGDDLTVSPGMPGVAKVIGVAAQENGDFLVVWERQLGAFGTWDIWARRYCEADGVFEDALQVNNPAFAGHRPAVAALPDGGFLIVWNQDGDVYARRLEAPTTGITESEPDTPRLRVSQNYPNPFGQSTLIRYELDAPAEVTIRVFDVHGALVTTLPQGVRSPGPHAVTWSVADGNGRPVASGTYFCEVTADGLTDTIKMLVVR